MQTSTFTTPCHIKEGDMVPADGGKRVFYGCDAVIVGPGGNRVNRLSQGRCGELRDMQIGHVGCVLLVQQGEEAGRVVETAGDAGMSVGEIRNFADRLYHPYLRLVARREMQRVAGTIS
jgi:hypothetical protein